MKKAKFALTAVAVLAVIGGALAFKANRQANHFYSFGTTIVDGAQTSGCVVDKTLQLAPTVNNGFITTLYSSAVSIGATTCTARVTSSL